MKHQMPVFKTRLDNGMHVLVRPTHRVPRVNVQLWYNVGSKDEGPAERGMAHLLEHMIFKGTERLSESDINMITHKLAGYTNAFTSYDYTAFVFRFLTNVWTESLAMLSDCMTNCTFRAEMLASELPAVIQEMKMYKDDYQSALIESMMAISFPEHPYHHPIIGYKQDLCGLNRDALYAFYKKHYHPGNATLVIVGDVEPEAAVAEVKKHFEAIPPIEGYSKEEFFINEDLASKSVSLYREVSNPWCFYLYTIPGVRGQQRHIFDLLSTMLARGKSSRLYQRLVQEEHVATTVECFSYDLFDRSVMCIAAQPRDEESIPELEKHLHDIVRTLGEHPVEEWEFAIAQKQAQMDHAVLLESLDTQAYLIGSSFLATGDESYLSRYLDLVRGVKRDEVMKAARLHLNETRAITGYLKPAHEHDKEYLKYLQEESDALDQELLKAKLGDLTPYLKPRNYFTVINLSAVKRAEDKAA